MLVTINGPITGESSTSNSIIVSEGTYSPIDGSCADSASLLGHLEQVIGAPVCVAYDFVHSLITVKIDTMAWNWSGLTNYAHWSDCVSCARSCVYGAPQEKDDCPFCLGACGTCFDGVKQAYEVCHVADKKKLILL